MLPIDASLLREIAPQYSAKNLKDQKAITDAVGPEMGPLLLTYSIDTRLRLAHFLARAAVETAGFRTLEEFASGAAYEGRIDLGNTRPGDGVRYKGRGIFNTTGLHNYSRLGTVLGIDLVAHPEKLLEPHLAVVSACLFWTDRGLNRYADQDNVIAVCKGVNGGTNGLNDQRMYLSRAKDALARITALTQHEPHTVDNGVPFPVLHRGSSGPYVESLQNMLAAKGHHIAVDGVFGPGTEAAVISFQQNVHVTSDATILLDGIVGPKTWAALDRPVIA